MVITNYLLVFGVVQLSVFVHSLDIVDCLFDDCDSQDENKWSNVSEQKAHLKCWNELRRGNGEEEEIVEHLELVEKNHGYQRDHIVLLVILAITWVTVGAAIAIKSEPASFPRDDAAAASAKGVAKGTSIVIELLLIAK